jgi:hypothetical protein
MAIELSDLENDMQVMDYIVTKLLKQNKKSVESFMNYDTDEYEESGDCSYRGFIRNGDGQIIDTLKCAVGHIISDEVYDEQLESQTVDNTFVIDARNSTSDTQVGLDCDNESISDFTKSQCFITDISTPYFFFGLIGNDAGGSKKVSEGGWSARRGRPKWADGKRPLPRPRGSTPK